MKKLILGSLILLAITVTWPPTAASSELLQVKFTPPADGGRVEWYRLLGSLDGSDFTEIYDGSDPTPYGTFTVAPDTLRWAGEVPEGEWRVVAVACNRRYCGPESLPSDVIPLFTQPGGCGLVLWDR